MRKSWDGEKQNGCWEEPLGWVCWQAGLEMEEELERGFECRVRELGLSPEITGRQVREVLLHRSDVF